MALRLSRLTKPKLFEALLEPGASKVSKFSKIVSRSVSTQNSKLNGEPSFGLLFDIDGVIVRGRKVLPFAPDAFSKLLDRNGNFRVPTVFVTNAGNVLRHDKARQLSEWLGCTVHEDQVVMSHSPLRMFRNFHDKRVLVSGQGPVASIAANLGFNKVTTLDELRAAFPILDAVDHKRRVSSPSALAETFPRIDAIVLFGEPIRWETALQLLIDVIMTNGLPTDPPQVPRPHIPILACNMDLQWMAEAHMPRFGHGAFLVCLENLYKKITGEDLVYSALIGKPSELTYYHSERMVIKHARKIGLNSPIKRLYAIGDNVNTDIFGANLYNQYLRRSQPVSAKRSIALGAPRNIQNILGDPSEIELETEQCFSVLVETGVYSQDREECLLDHSPRDFLPVEEKLREPDYTTANVLHAINLIFKKESYE